MSKEGIIEKKELSLLIDVAADKLPVSGFAKLAIKKLLPSFLDGIDNAYGDKIPEPWQSHIENMTTALADIFADGVVTEEETDVVLEKCSAIINEAIDIPFMDEEAEAASFLLILQAIAVLVKKAFKKDE